MSELTQYYEAFRTGYWAHEDAESCPCGGCGWVLSEVDTFHQCRMHYAGQPHPEDPEGSPDEFTQEDVFLFEAGLSEPDFDREVVPEAFDDEVPF